MGVPGDSSKDFVVFQFKAARLGCGAVVIAIALFLYACPARAAGKDGAATVATQKAQTVQAPSAPENPDARAPQPASISLKAGELTVEAHDSDLAGILRSVGRLSGMRIEGLGESSRVFGVYGPGKPREVIARLLNGSGYNFMMVGNAGDGVPNSLLLTKKTKAPPESSIPERQASPRPTERMEFPRRSQPAPATANPNQAQKPPSSNGPHQNQEPAPPPDLGPGAIYPSPPKNEADRQQRVQQMMDRLRKMHQQRQRELNEDQ